jgi:hypothetical protein
MCLYDCNAGIRHPNKCGVCGRLQARSYFAAQKHGIDMVVMQVLSHETHENAEPHEAGCCLRRKRMRGTFLKVRNEDSVASQRAALKDFTDLGVVATIRPPSTRHKRGST